MINIFADISKVHQQYEVNTTILTFPFASPHDFEHLFFCHRSDLNINFNCHESIKELQTACILLTLLSLLMIISRHALFL